MKEVTRFGWLACAQSQHWPVPNDTVEKAAPPSSDPWTCPSLTLPHPPPRGGGQKQPRLCYVLLSTTVNPANRTRVARLTKAENGIVSSSS